MAKGSAQMRRMSAFLRGYQQRFSAHPNQNARDRMADIAQPHFAKNLLALLKQTFEGPAPDSGTYLEKGAGLLTTLDEVTADVARHVPSFRAATIAPHCAHLAYYVCVNHNSMLGREQHVDWPSSWRLRQVGDREWEELKSSVRREYRALVETLQSLETWSDQAVGDSMAIVAHTAHHLGAIRHAL
jgi:hypothetical protein